MHVRDAYIHTYAYMYLQWNNEASPHTSPGQERLDTQDDHHTYIHTYIHTYTYMDLQWNNEASPQTSPGQEGPGTQKNSCIQHYKTHAYIHACIHTYIRIRVFAVEQRGVPPYIA